MLAFVSSVGALASTLPCGGQSWSVGVDSRGLLSDQALRLIGLSGCFGFLVGCDKCHIGITCFSVLLLL